jgi:hypothetical protein
MEVKRNSENRRSALEFSSTPASMYQRNWSRPAGPFSFATSPCQLESPKRTEFAPQTGWTAGVGTAIGASAQPNNPERRSFGYVIVLIPSPRHACVLIAYSADR